MDDSRWIYYQEQKARRLEASGARGLTKGRRPRKPRLAISGPIEDLVIVKDGVTIVIPANWFTKTGRVRKKKQQGYKTLMEAIKQIG